MTIGASLLNIRNTFVDGVRMAKNYAAEYPLLCGGVGIALAGGLIAAKTLTETPTDNVNRMVKNYQDYNSLSLPEKVKEFYKNGGKGVNFDKDNHLCNVVNADDGGKIYVYSDRNEKVIGSINTDRYGRVRNISRDNPESGKIDLSVNMNAQTGRVRSVYVG